MLSKLLYSPLQQKALGIGDLSLFDSLSQKLAALIRRAGFALGLARLLIASAELSAAELDTPANFLGSLSCSSASCHGGAVTNKDQYLVWSRQDYHSRAYATLTTARSKRLAEVLKIGGSSLAIQVKLNNVPAYSSNPGLSRISKCNLKTSPRAPAVA